MFKKVKLKIRFYKCLLVEVIETLCSICLYLECERNYRNPYQRFMRSHFEQLKKYSEIIRAETPMRKNE